MTKRQQATALMEYFLAGYLSLHKRIKPRDFNRNSAYWGFESMITDLGIDRAKQIVDDYLDTSRPDHQINYLLYHYHEMDNRLIELEEDEKLRLKLREETRKLVEEN